MALTEANAIRLAESMIVAHDATLLTDAAKGKIRRYLVGDHDLPYMPRGSSTEYTSLARRAVTNWLPLVSDTFSKALFVDGYRPEKTTDNVPAWAVWQANGLDARQTIAHRGALEYGTSHVLVLPGLAGMPVVKPLPPTRTFALYEDPDDEYPVRGIVLGGFLEDGSQAFRLYDSTSVYSCLRDTSGRVTMTSVSDHGLGVTPLVRFRDRLDGEAVGIISPLVTLQDRVNETVFSLLIAQQYASFRQRWATGLAIPTDTDEFLEDGTTPNPNLGKPIQPFSAAIDRLWVSDSTDAKFGDFAQTETSGHLNSYKSAVQSLAAIGQTPPNVLLGDLVNLSADALAAAEASTQRKVGEYETLFGESWEQVFRLASVANPALTIDDGAQVRWRDTEARSLASTVDALGKMVTMLGVPAEGAWERIPGVTDGDVTRWKELRKQGDVLGALVAEQTRQTAPNPDSLPDAPA